MARASDMLARAWRLAGIARAATHYLAERRRVCVRFDSSPLDALLDSLGAVRPGPALCLRDLSRAVRVGERIARAAAVDPDTCLFRALARYSTATRCGHHARFVMGIDERDPDRGHAWIEIDDAPFLEPERPPFLRTLEHPARA